VSFDSGLMGFCCLHLQPWRSRQHVLTKSWCTTRWLNGATSQKNTIQECVIHLEMFLTIVMNYWYLYFGLYPSSLCLFRTTAFRGMALPPSSGETYSVGSVRSS
jgi:hypothetical protein